MLAGKSFRYLIGASSVGPMPGYVVEAPYGVWPPPGGIFYGNLRCEDGKPVAAVVTQVTLEPVKRCLMWLIGGSRTREWVGAFLAKIEAYAREWGCVALWGAGRKGWARIVEVEGFIRIADTDGLATWEKRLDR